MSNTLSNYAFAFFSLVVLTLITWGPTLLSFRGKRQRGESVPLRWLTGVLVIELAAVIVLGLAADRFGLLNVGGYLLVIALLVGAGGGQIFSRMKFKPGR